MDVKRDLEEIIEKLIREGKFVKVGGDLEKDGSVIVRPREVKDIDERYNIGLIVGYLNPSTGEIDKTVVAVRYNTSNKYVNEVLRELENRGYIFLRREVSTGEIRNFEKGESAWVVNIYTK